MTDLEQLVLQLSEMQQRVKVIHASVDLLNEKANHIHQQLLNIRHLMILITLILIAEFAITITSLHWSSP